MIKEKRKVKRFGLALTIMIRDHAPMDNKPRKLISRDISSAGAFLLTNDPLPLGAKVNLSLFLPLKFNDRVKKRKIVINTSGKVIRADEHGMAVSFDKKYEIKRLFLFL